MVSACNAFFNVIQRLHLKTFFCSCPLRNGSCFIDNEHKQTGPHSTLSMYRLVSQSAFCKSARESSHNDMKRLFGKISLHSIVPKNHYVALALCNASPVCLLGYTTWYAKSHAMSMMDVINNLHVSCSGIIYFFICSQIGVTVSRRASQLSQVPEWQSQTITKKPDIKP